MNVTVIKIKKCGMEMFSVVIGGESRHEFFSREAANAKAITYSNKLDGTITFA